MAVSALVLLRALFLYNILTGLNFLNQRVTPAFGSSHSFFFPGGITLFG